MRELQDSEMTGFARNIVSSRHVHVRLVVMTHPSAYDAIRRRPLTLTVLLIL